MAGKVSPSLSDDLLSREEWLARAHSLVPDIRNATDIASGQRDVPAALVAQIKATGLFRALQPARWGGFELDPRLMLDVQNIFAAHCLSTAWIYGVLSVQSFLLGRMDPIAQAEVWEKDGDTLISSSFAPVAKVTQVSGGYRISGRFTYSSGSSHAQWAMVGGMVPPMGARNAPQMRLFLVPRRDYKLQDVWDTIGLRATGSNDLLIDDAFVPEHRTYVPDSGLLPLPAASGLPPLFRLPWLYMFASMISNLAIGAGRGALANFAEVTKTRSRMTGFARIPARSDPACLSIIGRARVEIDGIERELRHALGTLMDHVARDDAPSSDTILAYRAQQTAVTRHIAGLVDEMMLLLGGAGIKSDGVLTRVWLDLMAARAHPGNDPEAIRAQLAGDMLS